ncbi:hypothetical protein TRAPUB_11288 [Trametes pubescens]|uniref:Uncharacterized protein n=1 Tax=Trametes pubescens TaxID=154538 RepID=A0A1M2VX67_TRAPU|nr:hypothetical protein TRAPUB_11288 [Trametes pubescens]
MGASATDNPSGYPVFDGRLPLLAGCLEERFYQFDEGQRGVGWPDIQAFMVCDQLEWGDHVDIPRRRKGHETLCGAVVQHVDSSASTPQYTQVHRNQPSGWTRSSI